MTTEIKRLWAIGTKITVKSTKTEIYLEQDGVYPIVRAYKARATKPFVSHRFATLEKAHDYIYRLTVAEKRIGEEKAAAREAAKKPHTLAVGDILYTSWGYEQTNVEFYQVIELKGKTVVVVREIKREIIESSYMAGNVIPVPNAFIGDAIERRANPNNYLRISASQRAHPLKYETLDTGTKVYESRYTSSYY